MGHLRSLGIRIQQKRLIKTLVRVDQENSRLRWACLINRRKYNIPGPNSLWHADRHHSFINWGFVIHGAVDGFVRVVVYLKCAANNKSETVISLFQEDTLHFGIPSPLRSGKDGENVLLWSEMEARKERKRGSYIASSLVRNQRIERHWRYVWTYAASGFYYTFQAMESEAIYLKKFQSLFLLS